MGKNEKMQRRSCRALPHQLHPGEARPGEDDADSVWDSDMGARVFQNLILKSRRYDRLSGGPSFLVDRLTAQVICEFQFLFQISNSDQGLELFAFSRTNENTNKSGSNSFLEARTEEHYHISRKTLHKGHYRNGNGSIPKRYTMSTLVLRLEKDWFRRRKYTRTT